jgi:carboxymethylenebutenolidase
MGEMITIAGQPPLPAYLARPEGQPKGAVLVIHEVWGLADHIKSVADRLAAEGYVALAPDLLSAADIDVGSIINLQEALFDPDRRAEVQPQLRRTMAPMQNPAFGKATLKRVQTCFDYLYKLPEVAERVAVAGFCFGGTYSFNLAVAEPRLKAAIPFYGHNDHSVDELRHITCPVMAFYGENDENLTPGVPELAERMAAAGVRFTYKIYSNCGHAFFNDTNRRTYNREAAADAWRRTLALLAQVMPAVSS